MWIVSLSTKLQLNVDNYAIIHSSASANSPWHYWHSIQLHTLQEEVNHLVMGLIICRGEIRFVEVFVLFISCVCLQFSISTDTITIINPITYPETIISSNHFFQLGFFNPVNSTNYYVGIWFSNTTDGTVVWVANRDRPLSDSLGTMKISEDGNLVVLNGQKQIIWSSTVPNSSATNLTAQLLDSGNLVLRDKSPHRRKIWESFQDPTDSCLPTMQLGTDLNTGKNTSLRSWKSPSDPSVGSFTGWINPLTVPSVGNFSVGNTPSTVPELVVWNGTTPYWRSGPWTGAIFIGIENMTSGFSYATYNVQANQPGIAYMTFTCANQSLLLYYLLNYNGIIMEMQWTGGVQGPENTWSSRKTECDVYGKCGPFGSCDPNKSPICTCLAGFEPKVVEEWNSGDFASGCVRRTPLLCERNGSSSQGDKTDGFFNLTRMKVPDFAVQLPLTADECQNQCLSDCSCTAYSYYSGFGCMVWSGGLIDIQKFLSDGADLYIRVANSELGNTYILPAAGSNNSETKSKKVVIAITVTIVSISVAIFTYFTWMCMVKQRGLKNNKEKTEMPSPEYSTVLSFEGNTNQFKIEELPLFKFEELAVATNNFHLNNKLGQGGFGPVYKGKLPDGQEIAVKRLSRSSGQGLEEFMNEVIVISKLQHRNLVRLLGCCIEGREKMLIYEYMPNKSLDSFLFDRQKKELLDWRKRAEIIEGIGRGLLYLHRDSRLRIIHRDLKASNILLDEELNPKISDFGMARIFGIKEDQANTIRVVGTYGYMAPEYAMEGRFSEKSDVFSFGVLLLEIVSGRRNTSFYNDEQSLSLLGHVWKLWNQDNIFPLIDPTISHQEFQLEIIRCIHVGLLCVQDFAKERPTISTVLSMLSSEITYLPKPNQPTFTQRQTSSEVDSSQHAQETFSLNDCTVTTVEGR